MSEEEKSSFSAGGALVYVFLSIKIEIYTSIFFPWIPQGDIARFPKLKL